MFNRDKEKKKLNSSYKIRFSSDMIENGLKLLVVRMRNFPQIKKNKHVKMN